MAIGPSLLGCSAVDPNLALTFVFWRVEFCHSQTVWAYITSYTQHFPWLKWP